MVSGWVADFVKIFLTFNLVALAWVLFRSSSLESTLVYFERLFGFQQFAGFNASVLFAGSLMISLDVAQIWFRSQTWLTDRHELRALRYTVAQLLLISVLCGAIAHVGTITPFIYFQF
jgi:hypothetical protein